MYTRRLATTSRASLRSVRVQSRAVVRRHYATESAPESNAASYFAAGVGGGAVVLAGVYGWYSFSGTKKTVNTTQSAISQAQQIKNKAIQATPDAAVLLGFIRSTAKSYTSAVPGADTFIDQGFDNIEKAAKKHGPEVKKLVANAYNEVADAVSKGGDEMADKVMQAVQKAFEEAQKLSGQLSANVIQPLLEKNPELKEAINSSYADFRDLASKHGPKAQEIYEKTTGDIKRLIGNGLGPQTIPEVKSLIEKRSREVRELAEGVGKDAWKDAAEKAGPYLEKMPDVREKFSEYLDDAKDYVGEDGQKLIKETYERLEQIGKKGTGKEQLEEAKKVIQENGEKLKKMAMEKGGEVSKKGGEVAQKVGGIGGLESLLKTIPGGDKIMPQFEELKQVAEKRGEDVEKLVNSTYQEISEVLRKKIEEAQKLGKEAKDETKSKS